jgi:hypothetical protein
MIFSSEPRIHNSRKRRIGVEAYLFLNIKRFIAASSDVRGVLVAQAAIFFEALVDDPFNSAGRSGFRRVGEAGTLSRIALKITPELSPRNGSIPVAIS